jgi:putative PIN family toxin of toxin-antitoxin system
MTFVLDTNVVLSAFLYGGKPKQVLQELLSGNIQLAISESLIKEIRGVLQRSMFGLSSQIVQTILSDYTGVASWIEPVEHFDLVQDDPNDNQFIDCAVAAKADYLITGDKHPLKLATFRMVKIVSVDNFLESLSSDQR